MAFVPLTKAIASCLVLLVSFQLWAYFSSPLRNFPGPFSAKFTNLWRFFDVWGGRPELTQRLLHQKHGSAVRLGPNLISLSDPQLIRTIYSIKGNFVKTDFYSVNDVKIGRHIISNIFGTRSNEFHAAQVRPIQQFYTMTGVKEFEPLVDKTISVFRRKIDEQFACSGKVMSLDSWLLYYAWDVVGEITYSQPLGFLETAKDVDDILSTSRKTLDYFATISQIPFLDSFLDKNPVYRIGPPSFGSIVNWIIQRLIARSQGTDQHSEKQRDYMDLFIGLKDSNDWVDDNQIASWLMINTVAGSDTTALTLRAIFYYALKNPRVRRKLYGELAAARPTLPISYDFAQKLPYLDAVIRESMRMHPGVGLPLERVVPSEGLKLPDGRFIAGGTAVGMNAWVVHQNKEIFGQDAESFVPERWLQYEHETETSFQARRSRMREADLTFGAGNRVCTGKNIALLQLYKVVATLFILYDMELADQVKEWHVQNSWFVRQTGVDIIIRLKGS